MFTTGVGTPLDASHVRRDFRALCKNAGIEGVWAPRELRHTFVSVDRADYTASGRSLDFIEDFIRDAVLPRYANTHSESSGTGLATSRLREDARRVIRDAVGGTADDLVIFCGSGATAAVNKLIGILELRIPAGLEKSAAVMPGFRAASAATDWAVG